ncbi:MAG: DUF1987 domain-containing protein [Cytophagales bacterium]|nr:DUF1987 domain-containing protein [Cytophagales bacterium]
MNTLPINDIPDSSQEENFGASSLYLEPTRITPYVLLDEKRQCLIIKGRSSPDNSLKFFDQISDAIASYLEGEGTRLIANINLEYFSTRTGKCLYNIFKELKEYKSEGIDIQVNWYFSDEDEDMLEMGEDYSELSGLYFTYIGIED